jgi:transcriptional regulator with XRE-family HTH domain
LTSTIEVRRKIEEKGLKLNYIARKLGVTPYGLSLKLNNQNEFKSSEISIMCDILGITDLKEKESLFFSQTVDK